MLSRAEEGLPVWRASLWSICGVNKNDISISETDFLCAAAVRDFLSWLEGKLDGPGAFVHHFRIKKTRIDWNCCSVYNAYENYSWPFRFNDPLSGTQISGSSFSECERALDGLAETLRQSIEVSDAGLCAETCRAILQWGGVLIKNDRSVAALGGDICEYLRSVKMRLRKDLCSADYYFDGMKMNSGFTKIYSLCAEDFIIYDGRLGAALGMLSRLYCEENDIPFVPEELLFSWGRGRGADPRRRDPGNGKYRFPELGANEKRHLENNIRANWLIREILRTTTSPFGELEPHSGMRALESALFMIGYQVNNIS
jgi:hypothetical protein